MDSRQKNNGRGRVQDKVDAVPGGWILKNLVLAVAAVLVFVTVISLLLRIGTQHGKEIEVPDFTNMIYSEALPLAKDAGVKIRVTDSVYVPKMRKDAVYNQAPKAGEHVKKGRIISLTTNSRVAKKIAMPSLVGLSMQQASAELASKGLTLGKLVYVRDIATNNVIKQRHNGRDIKAGSLIYSGSTVDLVVGLNSRDGRTYVPDVKGKKYVRAVETIHGSSLNVGKVSFDSSVRNYADSLNAVVCSQTPAASRKACTMGTEVSITLTVDPSKLGELEK